MKQGERRGGMILLQDEVAKIPAFAEHYVTSMILKDIRRDEGTWRAIGKC